MSHTAAVLTISDKGARGERLDTSGPALCRMLEDEGYYCVDNLPVRLIDKFMELVMMPASDISKVALGLDVRADKPFAYRGRAVAPEGYELFGK